MTFACVAVTRGGRGDVWGFGSMQEAADHPLIQHGDAIVTSGADVTDNWNYLHVARMAEEVLGDRKMAEQIREHIRDPDWAAMEKKAAQLGDRLFVLLQARAKAPPASAQKIMELVTRDRREYDRLHQAEQTRRSTLMTTAAETTAAKPAAEKKVAGHPVTAKITLGKDKDNKSYGKDNNPKRKGSKSAERFELYKNGMTIEQALAAGLGAADIAWDIKHQLIHVA